MNRAMKSATTFLIVAAGIAVIWLAVLGGIALLVAHGQEQSCARSGGHWIATDTVKSVAGDTGVDRRRECQR